MFIDYIEKYVDVNKRIPFAKIGTQLIVEKG